jgi:hypothetical protein
LVMVKVKSEQSKFMKWGNRLFVYLSVFLLGCSPNNVTKELNSILGLEEPSFKVEFAKNDFFTFNGEGYSIQVLKLSDETIQSFIDQDKTLFPIDKRGFTVKRWVKNPITVEEKEIEELVTTYFIKDNKSKKYQNDIAKLLKSDRGYYSYYFKSMDESINSVLFFLVDTDTKKLYAVNTEI